MTFTRRNTLRTLAAIPFTAPLARAWAQPAAPPARKLVLVMQNNGTQQANFWPDAQLRSPILDALFRDASGADNGLGGKTNLIKGVYLPYDANGTNGNQHDMGFARMFTGAPLLSKAGRPWGGGPSVDQLVARAWDVDSLTLAVLASGYEPFPKPGFDHRRSFCYTAPGTLKYPLIDPLQVYTKLFATGTGPAAAGPNVRERLRLRRSVLDAVSGNLSEVASRVGKDEKRKLDLHLGAIRDVERRLERTLAGGEVACAAHPAAPPDYRAMNPAAEVSTDEYIPALVDNMVDLAAVALTCGLMRIATLQLGYGGGKWGFAWAGVGLQFHDYVAHADNSDAGSSPENTARVVAVNQYYASRVARLATALNRAPDAGGDGTVLDNTLVVWANEQGRGDHSQDNIPVVMMGRVGRGIARGGRTIDVGPQVFNRLGCTILNQMDVPADGFGDEATCGSFAGL
jgi:hypothetical protein